MTASDETAVLTSPICVADQLMLKITHNCATIGDWGIIASIAFGKNLVVELGTNIGTTTALLAYCAERVVTIDVFEDIDLIENEQLKVACVNHHKENRNTYAAVKGKLAGFENVELIKSLTVAAASMFEDLSVDVLFIDADHRYAGVKGDYEAWVSKVKTGGKIAFHDVAPTFVDITNYYVNELCVDPRIKEYVCLTSFPTSIRVFEKL